MGLNLTHAYSWLGRFCQDKSIEAVKVMREDSCALTHGVKHLFIAIYINTLLLRVTSVNFSIKRALLYVSSFLSAGGDGDGWFQRRRLTLLFSGFKCSNELCITII